MGKAPTFGYNDSRPIKEQRESLPIFKLRDQFIQAVNDNQVSCKLPLRKAQPSLFRASRSWVELVLKNRHG